MSQQKFWTFPADVACDIAGHLGHSRPCGRSRYVATTSPDDATSQAVTEAFVQCGFVVPKSTRKFSSIALDQAHVQENVYVKGDGGAVCLPSSPNAL